MLKKTYIFNRAVTAVFLSCAAYWSYLFFVTQMPISCDSIGYEKLGLMIYKNGWTEFFKTGPHREPFYPAVIAFSMRIADALSLPYITVQKIIQVVFLLTSQILLLVLLNRLKVANFIKLAVIFYFGISPAIVNSAFCLLSEIITYPFILLIVLACASSWQAIYRSGPKEVIILSAATALLFAGVTFCKGLFEYLFFLFMLVYLYILVKAVLDKNRKVFLKCVIYIMLSSIIFGSLIVSYKLTNKRSNGYFMLKEGGAWFLAGSAIKRAEPITLKVLLAHAASIPGGGVCRLFFTEDECRYTEFHIVDQYGAAALQKISAVAPKEKVESALLSLSLKKIAERPFQYIFYMCIEAAKMPFWESTQMGFVIYPPWLENFFGRKSIRFSIRFIPAALTYLAVFSLTVRIFKRRHTIFNSGTKEEESIICFFMLLVIFIFTSLHSPFAVLARYNLPIAPLYIACIAYFLHNKIYLK